MTLIPWVAGTRLVFKLSVVFRSIPTVSSFWNQRLFRQIHRGADGRSARDLVQP